MNTNQYPLQVKVWPILTTDAAGTWKHPVSATSFERALVKVLDAGNLSADTEELPYNVWHPKH